MTSSRKTRALAWTLGLGGVLACCAAAGVAVAVGVEVQILLAYPIGVAFGLLGALIASRQPRNSIGWLMCAASLTLSLAHLPVGYGYLALVTEHGALPLGSAAVWLGAWGWAITFVFFPVISVRFPDGNVQRGWRAVDWLSITGVAVFAAAIADSSPHQLFGFLPITGTPQAVLAPHFQSPLGSGPPDRVAGLIRLSGLALTLLGFVASAASLAARYRHVQGDERRQLNWFAYAGVLAAAAFVYTAVAWNYLGQPLYQALTPFEIAVLTLPIAIGIAILRYRLYDIDVIINRTLVYFSLTAILGAMYAAVVTLLNRLFIAESGQKSDAAFVITAFVVVIAASPIKDWLQRQVDRRLSGKGASVVMDRFRANVESVVSVIDVPRVARQLMDEASAAFDARGAALFLDSIDPSVPAYSSGQWNGNAGIEVVLRYEDRQLGRLVMAARRGAVRYTDHDRQILQQSADAVGEALALAEHLGFQPMPKSRR